MRKGNKKTIINKLYSKMQYLALISVIYASATPISSLYYTQIALVFFFISVVTLLLSVNRGRLVLAKRGILGFLIIISIILCSAIINTDSDIRYYLGLIVLIGGSYIITISIDYRSYEIVIIKLFTIVSLLSFFITIVLNTNKAYTIHLPRLVAETRTGIVSWGNFYYLYYTWDFFSRFGFIRNSACFREPGVWGSFCVLVLGIKILEVKKNGKKNKSDVFQLIALSIGCLSSLSTTAIIGFIICLLLMLINGQSIKTWSLSVALLVLILLTVVITYYNEVLFNKFSIGTSEYKAYIDRLDGISNSFKAFLTNPIFGAGYTNYYTILNGKTLTVAFIVILGEFGILGLIWTLHSLCAYSRLVSEWSSDWVLFGLLLIVVLLSQNLVFVPFILILCLYTYSHRNRLMVLED